MNFSFIWCDGRYPGSQWYVRVTLSLKHSNLLALFQFWLALQRRRGRSTALRARSVHHAGAHPVVAVVTFLCHGHCGHAAWSERHPQLWPQQFHAPESRSTARPPHCLRLGLSGQRHRGAWDPGKCSPSAAVTQSRSESFIPKRDLTYRKPRCYLHASAFPTH